MVQSYFPFSIPWLVTQFVTLASGKLPRFSRPIVDRLFDEVPVGAVLAVREEAGAAEAEHEEEGSGDVYPEVHHHPLSMS
jgi:hypothetical protein